MSNRASSLPIDESILDDDFFRELEDLLGISEDAEEENRNCGTGAIGGKKGFTAGNTCATGSKAKKGGGEKDPKKSFGRRKKKDVHSDWDDGKSAAEAGWTWNERVIEPSGSPFEPPTEKKIKHKGIPKNESKPAFNSFRTDSGKKVGMSLYPVAPDDAPTRGLDFNVGGDIRLTNQGEAMSIIRQVSNNTISMFKDENIDGINFSAAAKDGRGRTRLYASLSKRIAKKTDSEAFAAIKNIPPGMKRAETKFYVVKKRALKEFKKNTTIFPTDGDLFDPKPVSGRPIGKWHTVPIDDFDWNSAFEEQSSGQERSAKKESEPWFLDELLNDESFIEQVEKMLESEESIDQEDEG